MEIDGNFLFIIVSIVFSLIVIYLLRMFFGNWLSIVIYLEWENDISGEEDIYVEYCYIV